MASTTNSQRAAGREPADTLGTVAETLLIPLYGRARFTEDVSRLISDPKAVEMVRSIDYDFAKFQGPSLFGSVIRTRLLDLWIQDWLAQNPTGTVVEIGAGLNTRFERIDNGTAHWIDLDLPDAIELRRKFFDDSDRRRMLAAAVTDEGWLSDVAASPGPWFFVAEAVLCFLTEDEVRDILTAVVERFDGALMAFDTWGTYMRDNQENHDALKVLDARVQWFADTAVDVERLAPGLVALDSISLTDCDERLLDVMSSKEREIFDGAKDSPWSLAYKLNRFACGQAGRT
jgi:O-methyltransferase involved in polyketide biosynthesis